MVSKRRKKSIRWIDLDNVVYAQAKYTSYYAWFQFDQRRRFTGLNKNNNTRLQVCIPLKPGIVNVN